MASKIPAGYKTVEDFVAVCKLNLKVLESRDKKNQRLIDRYKNDIEFYSKQIAERAEK